jgi:hypothetical protein
MSTPPHSTEQNGDPQFLHLIILFFGNKYLPEHPSHIIIIFSFLMFIGGD